MTWIQTYRGHAFSLEVGGERVYDLDDIAHALGNLCRFTGHADPFYSVAEHSVLVGRRVVELTHAANDFGLLPHMRDDAWLAGLFHDASEAYLGDVSRPLKRLPGMEAYRALEALIETEIVLHFDLTRDPRIWAAVKHADNELLAVERDRVFSRNVRPKEWQWLPPMPEPYRTSGAGLWNLSPKDAGAHWLAMLPQTLLDAHRRRPCA